MTVPDDRKITAHCPTCNKSVDRLRAGAVGIFSGRVLYFCSKACKDLFAKSGPVRARPSLPEGEAEGGAYPEVSSREPVDLSDQLQEVMIHVDEPGSGPPKKAGSRPEAPEEGETIGRPPGRTAGGSWRGISYGSLSLAFIVVQIILAVVSLLIMNLELLGASHSWVFLPLLGGVVLHALQTLKAWRRGGSRLALDDLLVLMSIFLYAVPMLRVVVGRPDPLPSPLSSMLVPSGIFVLVWAGRAIEEFADARLAEGAGLASIFEDGAVRHFMAGRMRGRSLMARLSAAGIVVTAILSPLAAGVIVLGSIVRGSPILDDKMWMFASAVSIALCPRLFRNTIVASFFAGLQNGARRGIRYVTESDFEKASVVDAVVFRKRGGMADEAARVVEMITVGSIKEESLLALVWSCEEGIRDSEVATAIVRFASARQVTGADIRLRRASPSKGVHCTSPYGEIIVGSRSFLIESGIGLAMVDETAREHERRGETVVFLAVDRKVQALFVLSNDLHPSAPAVCERLRAAGIVPAMISGDGIRTLEAIAEKTGIEQVRAEIPVTGWAAELERIRDTGHRLAIVGRPPSKDRVSMREDLVIEMGRHGEEDRGSDAGVLCAERNLELVVDVLDIAKMSRKTILAATFTALLVQVFAAGVALSGLVTPLEMGGLINVVAGALWFLRPRQVEPPHPG